MKNIKKQKVFVATHTNEELKFQIIIGPLKFSAKGGSAFGGETSKRGWKPVLLVATI